METLLTEGTFILTVESKFHGVHGIKETSHRLKRQYVNESRKYVFAFPLLVSAKRNVSDI
jgi:hypothetical protein